MNPITPVQNTNNIRVADFIQLTLPSTSGSGTTDYFMSTASYPITVPTIGTFTNLGSLINISGIQRDIKSTGNELTITLVGIDTANLGLVAQQRFKGSRVRCWHGFFDTNNQLITTGGVNGLYGFATGQVNNFQITETWNEEYRSWFGVIAISISSIQIILQNTISGRYTNDNSWQYFNPGDTSMNRVAFISTINYLFGKDAPSNS